MATNLKVLDPQIPAGNVLSREHSGADRVGSVSITLRMVAFTAFREVLSVAIGYFQIVSVGLRC